MRSSSSSPAAARAISRRATVSCAALLTALLAARGAAADRAPPSETSPPPAAGPAPPDAHGAAAPRLEAAAEEREPGALPVILSIVPGVVVHGAGHLAAGYPETGARLLWIEGLGVVATLGGIATIAATGASRGLIGPAIVVTMAGFHLFLTSWLADVYGVVAPYTGRGEPDRRAPAFEARVGYRYVHDPQFEYTHFALSELDARWGAYRLSPAAWIALDDTNVRLRLAGARRLQGAVPGAPAADGSHLDVEVAWVSHTYGGEDFAIHGGEIFAGGRLDLARLDPRLRGAFAEAGLGLAVQVHALDDHRDDTTTLLLARFGHGVYLGRPGGRGGEVLLYYDHRHDGYAAGMQLEGLGSGPAGHVGARAELDLGPRFGLVLEGQAGSAYVTGLSLKIQEAARGARPPAARAARR